MDRLAVVGIKRCGCIIYANSAPEYWDESDDRAVLRIIRSGGTIERMTVEDARKRLILKCPHDDLSRPQRITGAWIIRHKSGVCVTRVLDDGDTILYGDETSAVIFPTKKSAMAVARGRGSVKVERSTGYETARRVEWSRWSSPP